MRSNRISWNKSPWVLAATLAAGLVACGGDGGDGTPLPSTASIDVTAANRDSVSHAAAAGIMAISPVDAIAPGAGGLAADRKSAQALQGTASSRWLRHLIAYTQNATRQTVKSAAGPLAQALDVTGPIEQACTLSGTMSFTLDDVDNSRSLSPGDVLETVFDHCMESAFDTLHGTATLSFTQVDGSSFNARMVFDQLLSATENHSVTLSGAALLEFSQPSETLEITRMTADGPVVAAVQTHLFTDTVTLLSGFVSQATYEASAAPAPGSTTPGRTLSTVSGSLQSAAAGGIVEVSTDAGMPITSYDADAYPRSGVARVHGVRGTLLLTAVSASSVRLDLDTNDDGTFESSELKAWDWLL